jgi:hypothetical protein
MSPAERARNLRVLVSDEELAMVKVLADDAGLSAADIVRTLIRDTYRAKHGDKKPKPQKK